MLLCFGSAQAQRIQGTTYAGTLGGNRPVRLTLYPVDGLYVGKVKRFDDSGKTSTLVVGRAGVEGESFELREYTQDGTVTANWQLQLQGDSLKGKKYIPYTDQQGRVRLSKEKHTYLGLKKPEHLEGDYGYQIGEEGPQGLFSITKIGPDRIAIDAVAVTSAPARNIAAYQDTVSLMHHRFEHKFIGPTDDDVPCEIDLEGVFYSDFLRVRYTNTNPCPFYFGHRATLEGIFKKIR